MTHGRTKEEAATGLNRRPPLRAGDHATRPAGSDASRDAGAVSNHVVRNKGVTRCRRRRRGHARIVMGFASPSIRLSDFLAGLGVCGFGASPRAGVTARGATVGREVPRSATRSPNSRWHPAAQGPTRPVVPRQSCWAGTISAPGSRRARSRSRRTPPPTTRRPHRPTPRIRRSLLRYRRRSYRCRLPRLRVQLRCSAHRASLVSPPDRHHENLLMCAFWSRFGISPETSDGQEVEANFLAGLLLEHNAQSTASAGATGSVSCSVSCLRGGAAPSSDRSRRGELHGRGEALLVLALAAGQFCVGLAERSRSAGSDRMASASSIERVSEMIISMTMLRALVGGRRHRSGSQGSTGVGAPRRATDDLILGPRR